LKPLRDLGFGEVKGVEGVEGVRILEWDSAEVGIHFAASGWGRSKEDKYTDV
jgi:hypothetical protein